MAIDDGDLVRLARAGDAVAFRLLVERHRTAARARAARLCGNPDDADDLVQEAFLQAFLGLDRLRDPDRFGAWLAGIVLNVSRAAARRMPVTLLDEWPEPLHPASAVGLPSADDLDRTEALRAAVAELPAGQRRAVELYYYADLPTGQIGESPGAAKASLHKARRRLRAYIAEHRPDLVPTTTQRTVMIPVRVAQVQAQAQVNAASQGGTRPRDEAALQPVLVVLVDDIGRRALPLWAKGLAGYALSQAFERRRADPNGDPARAVISAIPAGPAAAVGLASMDLAGRLLGAAGAPVTAVDLDEIGPEVIVARITVAGRDGQRQVTARFGAGLALGIALGAPIRAAGPLMARLAVRITGDDLVAPFLNRRPARPAEPPTGPPAAPRDLAFDDGLAGWTVGGGFLAGPTLEHWQDYRADAEDGIATLRSTVPHPHADAFLGQAFAADDYRGATLALRGRLRATDLTGEAELWLHVVTRDRRQSVDARVPAVAAGHGWTDHEVTARIPPDAELVRFGLTLNGRGRVELRGVELIRVDLSPLAPGF